MLENILVVVVVLGEEHVAVVVSVRNYGVVVLGRSRVVVAVVVVVVWMAW